jgi:hypothetical protein
MKTKVNKIIHTENKSIFSKCTTQIECIIYYLKKCYDSVVIP